MKLSKATLAIIKNYSTINQNILLKPGSKLTTITPGVATILTEANVEESFPVQFGIYDLNEFLAVLSLFEDPELEFTEKFVAISEGKSTIKYFAAEPKTLAVPMRELTFPEPEVVFTLNAATYGMILKSASILKANDISIVGDGSTIKIMVADLKNATSSAYNIEVGTTDQEFKANIKIDNIKMLMGDYDVSLSSKKLSRFKSKSSDLLYYVALESSSTFKVPNVN